MADKELSISLRVKSFLAAGFADAKNSMAKFASSLGSNLMNVYAGIKLVQGAIQSLSGLVAKAWNEFAESDKASRNFSEALRINGEDFKSLTPKYEALASAMQKQAGISDDLTMQRLANMSLIGLETAQMESAAKAVAGLTRAGMGEEMAQKAVVAALNGNFEALTRYIPALKTANNEQEKAAIVSQYMADQWQMQISDMDTAIGSLDNLKMWFSEVFEEIGRGIFNTTVFKDTIKQTTTNIQELIASGDIAAWTNKLNRGLTSTKEFFGGLIGGFKAVWDWAGRIDQKIGDWEESLTGKKLGYSGRAVAENAKADQAAKEKAIEASKKIAQEEKAITKESLQDSLQSKMEERQFTTQFEKELEDAWKQEEEARKEAIKQAEKDAEDRLKAEKKAAEDLIQAKEDESKLLIDLEENRGDKQKKIWEDILAEKGRIAKLTVQEFIDEGKQKKDVEKGFSDEEKKASRLMKLARGDEKNLSKKDKEWMDAFKEIRDAGDQAKVAKENLMQIEAAKQTEALNNILTSLNNNHAEQLKLSAAG